ncbi:MAG: hypothetical protein DRI95_00705 [Bacteroidetes bacterium]|nr:MAG: hypothetical protein DRI95_00705 [Bacteroidota bacterium]
MKKVDKLLRIADRTKSLIDRTPRSKRKGEKFNRQMTQNINEYKRIREKKGLLDRILRRINK